MPTQTLLKWFAKPPSSEPVPPSAQTLQARAKLRVGIPRVLNLWSTHQFWIGFLEALGIGARHIEFSSDTSEDQARSFGKGRVVYFPWDIDRVYWEVMVDDHGRLLRNAIEWALDEERPVTVDGPGVLDVTMWKQKNSMTVHMVNLTNPMMMRPSFREMIPSPPQQVRLRLPEGRRVSKIRFLVAGTAPRVQTAGGVMTLTVPSIRDHEVIAIDFA